MKRKYSQKTEDSPPTEEQGEASVESTEETTVDSTETAAPKTPIIKRVAYKALYAVSFGAVFSSLLAQKLLVPKNSIVESALHDGAIAAKQAFEEKERLVEEVVKETTELLSVEELPAVQA